MCLSSMYIVEGTTGIPVVSVMADAASQSQIDQLKSDMQVIENHINRISYIKRGKSTNKYNVTCALQRTLNTLYNAGLSVDGGYGALSVNAVKAVQRSAGITADGIVGSGTLKVIRAKADAYIKENTYVSTNAYFESMVVPTSVKYSNSFNLGGTVRSVGAKIWYVTGQIIDNSTNRSVFYESERVGDYTYNIRNGLINQKLRFGSLSQGSYTLRYDVSTMDGHSFTQTYSFTVYEETSSSATTNATSQIKLNLNSSLEYAARYWENYNPAYTAHGADCANFVSQILVAGGLNTDSTWHDDTSAFKNVNQLQKYLSSKYQIKCYLNSKAYNDCNVKSYVTLKTIAMSDIEVGDIIVTTGKDNGSIYYNGHVMFVSKVENGKIYAYGHTSNRNGANYTVGLGGTWGIQGVIKTSVFFK